MENARLLFEEQQEAAEEGEGDGENESPSKVEPNPNKEKQKFDEEAFLTKWEEENTPVEIPDEVLDDIDNDYDFDDEEQQA